MEVFRGTPGRGHGSGTEPWESLSPLPVGTQHLKAESAQLAFCPSSRQSPLGHLRLCSPNIVCTAHGKHPVTGNDVEGRDDFCDRRPWTAAWTAEKTLETHVLIYEQVAPWVTRVPHDFGALPLS